ncbi:uncharacterized protein LOC135072590 isoform X2 [Ostrinia nubilalis]|uniref:uncharacterized protein LOC114364242 isoform X2 n=1 Tax=Ostrinia furnacalis TaxID=93504 RepID=UPI00103EE21D|nr:uncharacterized protein LOC114364242 isoform X2 [Ostrinia furnacalis]
MATISLTIQDILPYGNKSTNKKLNLDTVLPFVILPLLLLIATLSQTITIAVMVAISMGVLYVLSRPRQKNRSPFFFSWTLSSGIYLFLVFELSIMKLLEITQLENFIFLVLLTCTCYYFYKMKAVADFELATGSSKGKEYRWDCCVVRPNYIYFVIGQIFAFATILFGVILGLTTVCQPYVLFGSVLVPQDCDDVYFEFSLALGFVACIYGLGYLLVITIVLIHQLIVYIPKYTEPQWRRLVNVLNV